MKWIKMFFFLTAVVLVFGVFQVSAKEINDEVCLSYLNMYCVRCHNKDRICSAVGVQDKAQWQETIELMGEYGNLDKDVQDTVFNCMTSLDPGGSSVCGKKTSAVSPAAMPVVAMQTVDKTPEQNKPKKIFRSIGPADAMRMLQVRDDVIFLDVRTAKERSYGAIPGSKLVPIYDLVKGKIELPKDKPILLVCAVGGRSYMAGQVLSKQGYQEVYNLSGGVKGWYKAGLPITQQQ